MPVITAASSRMPSWIWSGVSGFAPPGDIHRVRNARQFEAISVHIYGTDLSTAGSSVRRYYELHVLQR